MRVSLLNQFMSLLSVVFVECVLLLDGKWIDVRVYLPSQLPRLFPLSFVVHVCCYLMANESICVYSCLADLCFRFSLCFVYVC